MSFVRTLCAVLVLAATLPLQPFLDLASIPGSAAPGRVQRRDAPPQSRSSPRFFGKELHILMTFISSAPTFSGAPTVLRNDAIYGLGCGANVAPRWTTRTPRIDHPGFAIGLSDAAPNSLFILAASSARVAIARCSSLIDIEQLFLPGGFGGANFDLTAARVVTFF